MEFVDQRLRIEDIGAELALYKILPHVREAGQFARELQPHLPSLPQLPGKGGRTFEDALTRADLIVEEMVGTAVWRQFRDTSFYGEEYERDHVSGLFPKRQPYLVTLDPINSTKWYATGLPQYEVIVAICDRDYDIRGALVYRPAHDDAFMGYADASGQLHARHVRYADRYSPRPNAVPFVLPANAAKVLYLDVIYGDEADLVRDAGYEPVFPWRDYAGQSDWPHASHGLFTGLCRGVTNPKSQLIDAGAFAFIGQCAGGKTYSGGLDRETRRYEWLISAADQEAANLMSDVHEAYQARVKGSS